MATLQASVLDRRPTPPVDSASQYLPGKTGRAAMGQYGSTGGVEERLGALEKDVQRIYAYYLKSLEQQLSYPRAALMEARSAVEAICKQVFRIEVSKTSVPQQLGAFLTHPTFKQNVPKFILLHLGTVQQYTNFGVHDQGDGFEHIEEGVEPTLSALSHIIDWFFRVHLDAPLPSKPASLSNHSQAASKDMRRSDSRRQVTRYRQGLLLLGAILLIASTVTFLVLQMNPQSPEVDVAQEPSQGRAVLEPSEATLLTDSNGRTYSLYSLNCKRRTCGDDGFGHSCGECDETFRCTDGLCVPDHSSITTDGPVKEARRAYLRGLYAYNLGDSDGYYSMFATHLSCWDEGDGGPRTETVERDRKDFRKIDEITDYKGKYRIIATNWSLALSRGDAVLFEMKEQRCFPWKKGTEIRCFDTSRAGVPYRRVVVMSRDEDGEWKVFAEGYGAGEACIQHTLKALSGLADDQL